MNTSNVKLVNNPEKVFLNFVSLKNKDQRELAKMVFRKDERIVFGRRLQILYLILSGYNYDEITSGLRCGRPTVAKATRLLQTGYYDKDILFKQLKLVFEKQTKNPEKFVGGSRTITGTKNLLGL